MALLLIKNVKTMLPFSISSPINLCDRPHKRRKRLLLLQELAAFSTFLCPFPRFALLEFFPRTIGPSSHSSSLAWSGDREG